MEQPQINTQVVYSTVANMLPQEGRDFRIDVERGGDNGTRLILTPLNAMGRAWLPFLQEKLEEPLERDGVTVAEGGVASSEVVTINSIRAQIEKDAEESLKRKIQSAEEDAREKQQAVADIRKAQVEKEGEDARPSEAAIAAGNAASASSKEAERLRRAALKIAEIRERVNRAAEEAATADGKRGRVWAVDMDAPLVSLFDRQDVSNKFQEKERIIRDIAMRTVSLEDVEKNAVYLAKQYILKKEA